MTITIINGIKFDSSNITNSSTAQAILTIISQAAATSTGAKVLALLNPGATVVLNADNSMPGQSQERGDLPTYSYHMINIDMDQLSDGTCYFTTTNQQQPLDLISVVVHEFAHLAGLPDNLAAPNPGQLPALDGTLAALGQIPSTSSSPNVNLANEIKTEMGAVTSSSPLEGDYRSCKLGGQGISSNQVGSISYDASANFFQQSDGYGFAESYGSVFFNDNGSVSIDGSYGTVGLANGGLSSLSLSSAGFSIQTGNGAGDTLTTQNNTIIDIAGAQNLTFDPISGEYLLNYTGGSTSLSASLNASGQGTATATGANGQSTTTPVSSPAGLYSTIGSAFGSSLGRIIAGTNPLAQVAVSTALGVTLGDIGSLLGSLGPTGDLPQAYNDVIGQFSSSVEQAGAGAVGALLVAELIDAAGISGLPADVLNTFAGHTVATIATNLVTPGADAITGTAGVPATNLSSITNWEFVGASFVGSEIASAIYQPSTPEGSEGAAVSTAVGTAVYTYELLEYSVDTGNPYVIAAAAVVAILGEIIGGVVGDLFGQTSTSHIAEANFAPYVSTTTGQLSFNFGTSIYQNGPVDDATGAGEAVTDALNDVLAAVGGTVLNVSSLTSFGVGFNTDAAAGYDSQSRYSSAGMAYYYFDNTGGTNPQFWAADTPLQTVVDYATMRELSEMVFSGGDPYMERAIDAALRSSDPSEFLLIGSNADYVPSTATLSGYIQIAQDYETYEANKTVINALIEANPTSEFAQSWISSLTLAGSMGFGTSIQGGTDDDVLGVADGDSILIGGGGDDTYVVNQGDGNVTIDNGVSYNNTANGSLDLTASGLYFTANGDDTQPGQTNLTFTVNGADLIIGDGAGDNATLKGWFAGSFAELNQIDLANGTIIGLYYMQLAVGQETTTEIENGVYISQPTYNVGIEAGNNATNGSNAIAGGNGEDVLAGGGGANDFITGGGTDIAYGGGGADEYELDAPGQLTIYNNETDTGAVVGSAASGSLVFGGASGGTASALTFAESGNDLVIDIAGTASAVTVKNWFAAGYAQLSSIVTADGDTISYANGVFTAQTPSYLEDWIVVSGATLYANGNYVVVAPNIAATVIGGGDTVAAGAGSVTTVNSNGNLDAVNLTASSGSTVIVDANSNVTVTGAGNAVDLNGSGSSATVTGAGTAVSVSGAGGMATLTGSGDTATNTAANSTIVLNGANESLNDNGSGTVTLNGASDIASLWVANESVTATGTGDTTALNGAGDTAVATGTGDSVSISGAGDWATLIGAGDTATNTAANSTIVLNGANESLNDNGSGTVTLNGASDVASLWVANESVTATGTGDTINLNGANDTAVATGAGDSISINGAGDWATLIGTGDTALNTGANTTIVLNGANEALNDDGTGTVTLNGGSDVASLWVANESVTATGNADTISLNSVSDTGTATGTNDTVSVNGTLDTATLTGSGDLSINTGGNSIIVLNGNWESINDHGSDNITLNGASDIATLWIAGEYVTAAGSSDTVTLNGATDTAVLTAASDVVDLFGAGDTAILTGASDTAVNYGAGVTVVLNGNWESLTDAGSGSVTLNGASDVASLWVANEAATVAGNSDTLYLNATADSGVITGSNDVVYVYGASDTVTLAGAGADILFASNASGTVYGSGNLGIEGTGISVAASNDSVTTQAGASFALIGSGDTVAVAASETIALNGSSDTLSIGGGFADTQLWFMQSGNDLRIDFMGTQSEVTVAGWFSGGSSQFSEITAGGLKLDSRLSSLVSAMASYAAAHPGFDPTAITQAPNDNTLQTAIAAAWHA